MHKHRGFPSRLTGTDFQFTIRRENKSGPTKLVARARYQDRKPADSAADLAFLEALITHFGTDVFVRGNLDAGRLSWFLDREIKTIEPFGPQDYATQLIIDYACVRENFPDLLLEE